MQIHETWTWPSSPPLWLLYYTRMSETVKSPTLTTLDTSCKGAPIETRHQWVSVKGATVLCISRGPVSQIWQPLPTTTGLLSQRRSTRVAEVRPGMAGVILPCSLLEEVMCKEASGCFRNTVVPTLRASTATAWISMGCGSKIWKKQLWTLWFGCLPGHDWTPEESLVLIVAIRISAVKHKKLTFIYHIIQNERWQTINQIVQPSGVKPTAADRRQEKEIECASRWG